MNKILSMNEQTHVLGNKHRRNETLSALQALCEGNPPITGVFPQKGTAMSSFNVYFFDSCLTNSRVDWDLRRHDARATSFITLTS